jgi:hypothetical protein
MAGSGATAVGAPEQPNTSANAIGKLERAFGIQFNIESSARYSLPVPDATRQPSGGQFYEHVKNPRGANTCEEPTKNDIGLRKTGPFHQVANRLANWHVDKI